MPVTHSSHPAVVHVATIRPADLQLPVSRPIDLSHLVAVEATNHGTG
jgi:hypothetical protein